MDNQHHFCIKQRTQQQLIQVKSIEEFGIFGIIPASLMLSKVCLKNFKILFCQNS